MQVPDAAVRAAMVRRADLLSDRPDPMVLSDETLTRLMLEAAAPFLAATPATETATTCCDRRNKVEAGPGGTIVHVGGNGERHCSGQRFTITIRRTVSRDEVLAVLAAAPGEDEEHDH